MVFVRKIKRDGKIYLAEVENKRINGKTIQKHIRYIGKEVDGETKLATSISDVQIDEVKFYGPLLVLHHIATQIGLPELLGECSNEILSLIYAHCLDYKSVSKMKEWFKRTDLSCLLNIKEVTEKSLLSALDKLDELNFDEIQLKLFNCISENIKVKKSCVIYDVTNTYFHGSQCTIAKLGHDKEGVKGRPLIQIGLAITKDQGFPLFHKVFEGNISDVKTLQEFMIRIKKYKISSGILVYDRGISSADNIEYAKKVGFDTLCGLPMNNKLKILLRSLKKNSIINISNRVKTSNTVFYAISHNYKIGTISGNVVFCFNEKKHRALRESRYDEIMAAEKLLKKNKKIKEGMNKYFNKNNTINKKYLNEAEEFDGYFCLFSTKNISKDDAVNLYFDKDEVEKSFQSIKGVTHLRPIRHWLYNRVEAHVKICYFSYSILSVMRHYLKKINITPATALAHLSSFYKIYMRDKNKGLKFEKFVVLKKIQKDILKSIDPMLLKCGVHKWGREGGYWEIIL